MIMKIKNIFLLIFIGVFTISGTKHEYDKVLRTVVIDAGHGGKDSGCLGTKNSKEKYVNLAIALELGKQIEAAFPDVKVRYTRQKDVFVELHKRAKIANMHNADLFISIHCNAAVTNKNNAIGSETYALGLHRADDNLEIMKRENDVILMEEDYENNYDYNPNSPENHIINAFVQNKHLEQSINFATKIERELVLANRKSRGVKQAGFAVLRGATMPAVLVESGFLTHPEEEGFLVTKEGQQKIAHAIFNAFSAYKSELEGVDLSNQRPKVDLTVPDPKEVENKGFEFKIQLAAVSNLENPNLASLIDGQIVEIVADKNIKKVMSKSFYSYQAADTTKQLWREKGFKDAFIVVYKDGEQISMKDFKALTEQALPTISKQKK